MTGRLGGGHPIADQCESGAQLLLIELWSAGMPPLRAGGGHAVAGSLGDQAPFELRDGTEDMKDQFAGGRGGANRASLSGCPMGPRSPWRVSGVSASARPMLAMAPAALIRPRRWT